MKRILIFFNLLLTLQIFSFDSDQDFDQEAENKEKRDLPAFLTKKLDDEPQLEYDLQEDYEQVVKENHWSSHLADAVSEENGAYEFERAEDRFVAGIKNLPDEVQIKAWRHYHYEKFAKGMWHQKAQNLAKIYQNKPDTMIKVTNSKKNEGSGCIIN